MAAIKALSVRYPWIWAIAGSIVVFVALGVLTRRPSLDTLNANLLFAGFLAIVALGQMFAVAGGGGGIDLSLASMVTLGAMVTAGVGRSHDAYAVQAVVAVLGVGLLVGVFNGVLIVPVRIPPMVATLATGFILESIIRMYYGTAQAGGPPPALEHLVHTTLHGLPAVFLIALLVMAIFGAISQRTRFGRALEAAGQSERAAALSGVNVGRTRFVSYVLSAVFGAITGILLSSYVGGAFLAMGQPYLLTSIGAVVVGGCSIAGGKSTTVGILAGAIFLTLVATLVEATALPAGTQDALEGLLLIAILAARGT